jgi:DNA-directed RNA polymerase subunit RPC12/RpoP
MSQYTVIVRLKDANIESLGLRGTFLVELAVTATSKEEATNLCSKYGRVASAYDHGEERGLSQERKKQLVAVAFYRPNSRNEEIYTYYICEKCKSYMTHQNVWCSQCGSKYIAKKGRASEFEKDGYEDAYSLFWYQKCKEHSFFEVSVELKSNVSINLEDGKLDPLGLVTCRLWLGIKAPTRHKAVETGAKFGEVYHCSYNRGDDGRKFFGIMIGTPQEPTVASQPDVSGS